MIKELFENSYTNFFGIFSTNKVKEKINRIFSSSESKTSAELNEDPKNQVELAEKKENILIKPVTHLTNCHLEKFRIDSVTQGDLSPVVVKQKIIGHPKPCISEYKGETYNKINMGEHLYCESIKTIQEVSRSTAITSDHLANYEYFAEVEMTDEVFSHWQPIPTLTANDDITAISANQPIKLGYSSETNQFYITAKNTNHCEKLIVNYNIQSKPKEIFKQRVLSEKEKQKLFSELKSFRFNEKNKKSDLPNVLKLNTYEQINVLAQFIHTFSEGELPAFREVDDIEILNQILSNGKGVCRHYAMLFMAFAKILGIEARMVVNDVHAFIEVKLNNNWQILDLGGGKLNLIEIPLTSFVKPQLKIKMDVHQLVDDAYKKIVNDHLVIKIDDSYIQDIFKKIDLSKNLFKADPLVTNELVASQTSLYNLKK